VAAIEERRLDCPEDWTADCLFGIETILVDDGLDTEEDANAYSWHDDYTRSKCKRIVRIEKVAADIIRRIGSACKKSAQTGDVFDDAFDEWTQEFDAQIATALEDPDVAGFKSVICYRTGLDITSQSNEMQEARAREDFKEIIANYALLNFEKLQTKSLNDLVVHRTAQLIRYSPVRQKKPIQFHTGLGDNDLALPKSSPSFLQDFIRMYPTIPIVLLHAGYPFTREAGYLASVYDNVYADIGEVFPCVSQDGQERILREILELCPWSKILWSTDGHWFPETYLLAVIQMREVFETVGPITSLAPERMPDTSRSYAATSATATSVGGPQSISCGMSSSRTPTSYTTWNLTFPNWKKRALSHRVGTRATPSFFGPS
jgi:hypothetical protein